MELARAAAAHSNENGELGNTLACIFRDFEVTRESAAGFKANLRQIHVDIPRTWAGNPWFADAQADGCVKLERVLMAYVIKHRATYIQSMNFVSAIVLAFNGGDEAEALCISAAIFESVPYYRDFDLLRRDTELLALELRARDPALARHLQHACHFDLLHVTPSWLLCCFFLAVAPDNAALVVSAVLKHRADARGLLLAIALDGMIMRRADLLRACDLEDVFPIMRALDRYGFSAEPSAVLSNAQLDARWVMLKSLAGPSSSAADENSPANRRRVSYPFAL